MDDTIDQIRAGWARVLPDVPTRSVGTISLIWRLSRTFHAHRAAVLAGLGIDQATLELLGNLRRSPDDRPMSPGELAAACGVTAGAVSLRLRRAEQSGWVVRARSAQDSRGVTVSLTPSGAAAADRYARLVLEHDEALIAGIDDADLAQVEDCLRHLADAVNAAG